VHQRLTHRDALVDARTHFRNQLHALEHQPVIIERVRARRNDLIATRNDQIAAVDQEIHLALEQDNAWATAAAYLASIKGLGTLTIAWFLTATRNVALTPSPEAAANYVRLVPHVHQSGTSVRGRSRIGHRGHARLRHALYMAALRAIQHHPMIKALPHRLLATGKPKNVAVCAAGRKLLRIAWAVATKHHACDSAYAVARSHGQHE